MGTHRVVKCYSSSLLFGYAAAAVRVVNQGCMDCCRYCELVEQHHPKDLLSVEEFLMLRNQVMSKPAAPPTVASSTDDDDMGLDAAEAADNVADTSDEPPPGVDDPPGTDASPHASNNKSKVCVC